MTYKLESSISDYLMEKVSGFSQKYATIVEGLRESRQALETFGEAEMESGADVIEVLREEEKDRLKYLNKICRKTVCMQFENEHLHALPPHHHYCLFHSIYLKRLISLPYPLPILNRSQAFISFQILRKVLTNFV